MNTTLLERCLDALREASTYDDSISKWGRINGCIADLEAAIAEQAKPQEPVAWYCSGLGDFSFDPPDGFDSLQTTGLQWRPLGYIDTPLEPMSEDAKRYQWLKTRLLGADFDWNGEGKCVIVFDWPKDVGIGGNCDMNIDAAIEEHHNIGVKK